jgi:tetratricopeptide (TPR) repeat protein
MIEARQVFRLDKLEMERTHFRIFLSSPADVAEERTIVRSLVKEQLPVDAFIRDRATFDLISSDDPYASIPYQAYVPPQDTIDTSLPRPSECDIVIVVLWSRMGTPLDRERVKSDGSRFQSGTEWEYEDAIAGARRTGTKPKILVYRRSEIPQIPATLPDVELAERREQWSRVERFFKQFVNSDGSLTGGVHRYARSDEFRQLLEQHLKTIISQALATSYLRETPQISAVSSSEPIAPARCFGRDSQTEDLVNLFLSHTPVSAVLVLGGPGVGKTTLTRAIATHAKTEAQFGYRRWFVELETVKDTETFGSTIVAKLGLDRASVRFDAALAEMRRAPGLLILDNLETPWEADREKTEALLGRIAAIPGMAILASMRGEEPTGGIRWARQCHLRPLEETDARHLFLDIAAQIAPDDPQIHEFLQNLGGIPLAIELVALRAAPRQNLIGLWHEWQSFGGTVASRLNNAGGRLDSLTRSIEFSLYSKRLTNAGRRLFALLGLLPSGIAEQDRVSLFGEAAAQAGAELLSVGLSIERGDRLDLLPPIRDYARRHCSLDDSDAAKWVSHYLILARDVGAQIGKSGGRAATIRLLPDTGNLEAALITANIAELRDLILAAGFGFTEFARFSGAGSAAPLRQLVKTFEAVNDTYGVAECMRLIGDIALDRSDHASAQIAYEDARPRYHSIASIVGEANCLHRLGYIALRRLELPLARKLQEEALSLFRQVKDVRGEANCIKRLGDVALACRQYKEARLAYEQALPLYQQAKSVRGKGNCIRSLADVALECKDYEAAKEAYEQALPLLRDVGYIGGEANCMQGLGDILEAKGELQKAADYWLAALSLYERIARPYSVGWMHQRLARISIGVERAGHIQVARTAWNAIDRRDLVNDYLDVLAK